MLDGLKKNSCASAERLGSHLKEVLNQARQSAPAIADVRGQGSMVAVEFNDPQTGEPSAEITRQIQQQAQENGLLLLSCGVYGNVIRFLSVNDSGCAVYEGAGYSGPRAEALTFRPVRLRRQEAERNRTPLSDQPCSA